MSIITIIWFWYWITGLNTEQHQMYASCARHGVVKLENKGHQLVCHYVCTYSNKGWNLKHSIHLLFHIFCGMCWAWGDRVIV